MHTNESTQSNGDHPPSPRSSSHHPVQVLALALVLLQGPAGGHHLPLVLLVVEAHVALELGLPIRGAAAGLLGGALGGGRGRGCQAGGEVGVDPAEGGGVCVDPRLLLLGGGHCEGWRGCEDSVADCS